MKRVSVILLVLACLIPFIRLGMGEIQPWDESLFAIRADACLKFGAWLDQTQYAVGGLYSATHPPLGVWFIAISKYLFGNAAFAVRFPIAFAASASILLTWLLIRKFASSSAALAGAVSLATADIFLFFSHLAQMECFILFFGTASILCLTYAIERKSVGLTIIGGILLGCGLLTKFAVAFFAVPFILLLPWILESRKFSRYNIIAMGVAIIVAAPWFIFMTVDHPNYWHHVIGSLAELESGGYAPSRLAWWYYLNQCVVALPLIVAAIFVRNTSRLLIASLVWLLLIFIGLQIVGTKMPHFAMLLLIPGALLIAAVWDSVLSAHEFRKQFFLFAVLLCAIGWSASEQVRLLVTHRFTWNEIIIEWPAAVIFIIASLFAIYVWFRDRASYSIGFSILLLGIALAHLFSEQESVYENGASEAATIAFQLPSKTTIDVIHYDYPHEQYAPQLAYYTRGWTLGWIPGKNSQAITLDSAMTHSYQPDSSKEIAIVPRFQDRFYHRPAKETALWDSLMSKFRRSFRHELDVRSYTVFY